MLFDTADVDGSGGLDTAEFLSVGLLRTYSAPHLRSGIPSNNKPILLCTLSLPIRLLVLARSWSAGH